MREVRRSERKGEGARTSCRTTRKPTPIVDVLPHVGCSHTTSIDVLPVRCRRTLTTSSGVVKSEVKKAPVQADSACSSGEMRTRGGGWLSVGSGSVELLAAIALVSVLLGRGTAWTSAHDS